MTLRAANLLSLSAGMVALVALAGVFSPTPATVVFCGVTTFAQTFCSSTSDSYGNVSESCDTETGIVDRVCIDEMPGGGPGGGLPPPPPPPNPVDQDENGLIDCWKDMVTNTADVVENNWRLGTDHGGPNMADPSHDGLDVTCIPGESVKSPCTGRVTKSEADPTTGLEEIYVERDDYSRCDMGHFLSRSVQVNDTVTVGDVIGTCGTSGGVNYPHIHYRRALENCPAGTHYCDAWTILDPEVVHGGCMP